VPYLKIQTNQQVDYAASSAFLQEASRLVARELSKPENYVMVALEPPIPMLFAGSDAPCLYMELKSIGLSDTKTSALSSALCSMASDKLGIPADRVYIEFADAPRKMWGWNSATF
jgi:phenylpyruvate tautomerase PptA (4-oxalocrotonate tautomerase family)